VLKKRKTYLIICPRNQQFKNIIACSAKCENHPFCKEYKAKIDLKILELYVEKHPEYKIIGELMPVKKAEKSVEKKKEKKYWIMKADKTIAEVSEKDIINNPQRYLDKEIWERPPFKYELVISLKKVKV